MRKKKLILFGVFCFILQYQILGFATTQQAPLLSSLTTKDFVNKLSLPDVPGSASAAAYTGAMATSLWIKAIYLYNLAHKSNLSSYIKRGYKLQKQFLDLMQADAEIFIKVKDLWGAKNSCAQSEERYQQLLITSTKIPLLIMQKACTSMKLAHTVENRIDATYRVDVIAGIYLDFSVINTTKIIVLSDAKKINNRAIRSQIVKKANSLYDEAHQIYLSVKK